MKPSNKWRGLAALLCSAALALVGLGVVAPAANATAATATDSDFSYAGGTWNVVTGTQHEHWISTANAYATIPFNVSTGGGTISLQGVRDTSNHTVAVSIDGGTETTVNENGARLYGTTFWTSGTLAAGAHTFKVRVVTGDGSITGSTLSNGTYGAPPPTSTSVTDTAFTYTGSWSTATNPSEHWTGSTAATASLSFTIGANGGTIALRAVKESTNNGTESAAIDGGTPATFSLNASSRQADVIVWTSPQLAASTHTLVVGVPVIYGSITGATITNNAVVTGGPSGPPGTWNLSFSDDFTGTTLDTTKWACNWYGDGNGVGSNGLPTHCANVTVSGGNVILTPKQTEGAVIHSDITGGARLPVGGVAEARVYVPGTSSTACANWPAWWANTLSADGWPSAGEHDILECLSGQFTVNYHSPSGSHNQGAVAGNWANSWHTYTIQRKATSADVYWDGVLVKSYSTDDNGHPEMLVVSTGNPNDTHYGSAYAVQVDYIKVWTP